MVGAPAGVEQKRPALAQPRHQPRVLDHPLIESAAVPARERVDGAEPAQHDAIPEDSPQPLELVVANRPRPAAAAQIPEDAKRAAGLFATSGSWHRAQFSCRLIGTTD